MLCSGTVAALVRDLCFQHGCGTNSPLKELEQMTSPVSLAYEEARIQCLRVPTDDATVVDFANPVLVAHRVWTDSGPVYLPAPVCRFLCTVCGRRLRNRGSDAEMSQEYQSPIHCGFCGSSVWLGKRNNQGGVGGARRRKRSAAALKCPSDHLICSPLCSGALCASCCDEVQRDPSFHVRCEWARYEAEEVVKNEVDGGKKNVAAGSIGETSSPLLDVVVEAHPSLPVPSRFGKLGRRDINDETDGRDEKVAGNTSPSTSIALGALSDVTPRVSHLPVDATLVIDELEDAPFFPRATPKLPLPRHPSVMLPLSTVSHGSVGGATDWSNAKWEVIWHTDAPRDDAHFIEMEHHFLTVLAIPGERLSSRPARNSSTSGGSHAWIVFFKTRLSAEDAKDALVHDALVVGSPLVLRIHK